MNISKKSIIQIVVVLIVVASLLSRDFAFVGKVLTIITIAAYLVVNFVETLKYLSAFKTAPKQGKVKAVTFLILFLILIKTIFFGDIPYFVLLVMLGIDYIMVDNHKNKGIL